MARTTWGPLTKEEQNSIPFTDPSPGGSIDGVTGTGLISMTAGVLDDPAVTLSDRVAADAANLRTQLGASAASGTSGKLSKFTGSSSLGDSILTESGTTVSVAGRIDFSLNTVPGLRLNNLTTAQRDATTPAAGALVWNTTTTRVNNYTGSAWTDGWVRLGGDTMTGPLVIGGGTVTASTPILNLTQTWNQGGTLFEGLVIDVTHTASLNTSRLIAAKTSGGDMFYVRRDGVGYFGSTLVLGNGTLQVGGAGDLILRREDAGILSLRNGANAQTFNIYGTADAGLMNYRRLRLTQTTGGAVTIAAEGLGTGVSGNTLALSVNGTTSLTISAGGSLFADNAVSYGWNTRARIFSPADAQLLLQNQGLTDADFFLKLGVNTSAACGIKRVGTELRVRLNDDSAYTFITGKLRTDTNYAAGTFTPTGYLTVYDLAGTAYRIPCAV